MAKEMVDVVAACGCGNNRVVPIPAEAFDETIYLPTYSYIAHLVRKHGCYTSVCQTCAENLTELFYREQKKEAAE